MRFSVDVDVTVPMRDGIALATNVWHPEGPGPFPVLLIRTPYGKDDAGTYGNPKLPDVFAFVEAGYAVVAQDVRGTSRSPGNFVPGVHESRDGADTLTWLAEQPWCDGTVGMWGGSYMGFTQWLAAAHASPALRAIAPVMSSADLYRAPWYSPAARCPRTPCSRGARFRRCATCAGISRTAAVTLPTRRSCCPLWTALGRCAIRFPGETP